jgi:hypothetical protein
MEQLLSLLKELQIRNEALARELGGTQAEVQYWKNKFFERNEQNMEQNNRNVRGE